MSFGPPNHQSPRVCPRCNAALPLPVNLGLLRCPVCGAEVKGPGEPGKALVEAMTGVLGDPLGKRKQRD